MSAKRKAPTKPVAAIRASNILDSTLSKTVSVTALVDPSIPGHGTKKKVGRVSSDRSALDPSANRAGWSAVMPGMRFTGCSNNGDKHFFGAVPHSWVARVNAGAIPTP